MESNVISEDYCSYEVTKLLKQKGFPFDRLECGWKRLLNLNVMETYTTVTHAIAMKWLREIYDIHISVAKTFIINDMDDKTYLVRVCTKKCHTSYNSWQEYHSTYKEAVEAALKYVLENLI